MVRVVRQAAEAEGKNRRRTVTEKMSNYQKGDDEGRPCEGCPHGENYHAATVVNGPRDGVCRVRGCSCDEYKGVSK